MEKLHDNLPFQTIKSQLTSAQKLDKTELSEKTIDHQPEITLSSSQSIEKQTPDLQISLEQFIIYILLLVIIMILIVSCFYFFIRKKNIVTL